MAVILTCGGTEGTCPPRRRLTEPAPRLARRRSPGAPAAHGSPGGTSDIRERLSCAVPGEGWRDGRRCPLSGPHHAVHSWARPACVDPSPLTAKSESVLAGEIGRSPPCLPGTPPRPTRD